MPRNSILVLSYWYPNKSNQIFGIFVKRHAAAMQAQGEVTVLSMNIQKGTSLYKKTVRHFTDETGIDTHEIYLESVFNKLLYVLLPLHYLVLKAYLRRQILPQRQITVLQSNVLFPCAIVGHRLARYLRCPHVITEHWTRIDKFFNVNLYRRSGKRALDSADAITCVSETLKQTLQKYTANPRIFIVPNVIDNRQFYYDSSITPFETFTFIAAASWKPFKNPFYFLDALQVLADQKRLGPFRVMIVGEGEQVAQMKARAYTYEIVYKGSQDSNAVRELLNRSHRFVHGSDYETFSVIIAEALMCGLPSVVSPQGIALTAINPGNGLVTDNTASGWETKLEASYHGHYNRAAIAEEIKDRYSPEAVGRLFAEVFARFR